MTQDQPIAPFDWFANQFTSKRGEEFVELDFRPLPELYALD